MLPLKRECMIEGRRGERRSVNRHALRTVLACVSMLAGLWYVAPATSSNHMSHDRPEQANYYSEGISGAKWVNECLFHQPDSLTIPSIGCSVFSIWLPAGGYSKTWTINASPRLSESFCYQERTCFLIIWSDSEAHVFFPIAVRYNIDCFLDCDSMVYMS